MTSSAAAKPFNGKSSQREILKSRHYILKFLARQGFVFREGTNWCTPHLRWLQHLTTEQSPLAAADRLVFREYHALLEYKLQRRDALDQQIEQLALLPALAPMVSVYGKDEMTLLSATQMAALTTITRAIKTAAGEKTE